MSHDTLPRAIFGDLLWGSSAMRYVFVDEAGTSEEEPITIVVGLIVNADQQLMLAEAAINEALGAVPRKFRDETFVFHASKIWSDVRYRDGWSMPDRLALLKQMMRLPRRLNIPISLGMIRRRGLGESQSPLSPAQRDHVWAFLYCLTRADKYIRDWADLREVATVVAEDVPEMRRFLRATIDYFRKNVFVYPAGTLQPTEIEEQLGHIEQESEMRVSRIRKAIHFAEKAEDPMLQLADACAFGLRRYFAEQQHGDEFAEAILGRKPPLADYRGVSNMTTFYFNREK